MQYFGKSIDKIIEKLLLLFMEVKTLEECIISVMELTDKGLVKYLPCIFQDHWELGTSSKEIIEIIKKDI